jgi:N-acetylglucosamine-6-phosphate deacetylase
MPDDYSTFLEYTDVIRSFTLAPKLPGALELIGKLKERGILVSAGHSIALNTELSHAVDAGLSHVTHMFCNMGTLQRVNYRRVAGMVESALLDDRLTAEIIGDSHHIGPRLMKLALKVKLKFR